MSILVGNAVEVCVEYPDGHSWPVLRDLATGIDLEGLTGTPHWRILVLAFAQIANMPVVEYEYGVSAGQEIIAEINKSGEWQTVGLPRGHSIYDPDYRWLWDPLGSFLEWMCGVSEAEWGRHNASRENEGDITPEEFRSFWRTLEKRVVALRSSKVTKQKAVKQRRSEFAAARPAIVLALLDRGVPYVCADPSCLECEGLTIDHKVPLSRGGEDVLENLQFMCRSHNSQKSDRADQSNPDKETQEESK